MRIRTADGSPPAIAALGGRLQLAAEVLDAAGAPIAAPGIAWSTGSAAIATVDASGLVTALANGTAKITAASRGLSADLALVVKQVAGSVAITPRGGSLERGATLSLHASAVDANGNALPAAPVWTTSTPEVALVGADGTVTGVAIGSTTVQAAFGSAIASATVQVVRPAVASVQVSGTPLALTSVGDTLPLSATALDLRGNAVEATAFTWGSSAARVASVVASTGLVTAIANGPATVTAEGGGRQGSLQITVGQVLAEVAVSKHTASDSSTLTSIGDALQLDAAPRDARGHAIASATVSWEVCDGPTATPPCAHTVAQVDAGGLVTAHVNGTARVLATAAGVTGAFTATVAQAVATVEVTPAEVLLAPTGTQTFTASALDARGHPVSGAPAATWESTDLDVIQIDAATGAAVAQSPLMVQHAVIRATIAGKHGTATVTVDPDAVNVATVEVGGAAGALASLGETVQLTATAKDPDGAVLSGVVFSWSSSDGTIASVDASGLVTAKGNGGATITAAAGGKSGAQGVTVLQQVASVSAAGATTLASVGDTVQLTAKDALDHAIDAGLALVWTSENPGAATVNGSGLVTAAANGVSSISVNNDPAGLGASKVVTVAQAVASVTPATRTVHSFGDAVALAALDARGHPVQASTISWTQGDAAVVSLSPCAPACGDAQESATAVGNGISTVTAQTDNDLGISASVEVAQFVRSVTGSPVLLRAIGASVQLSAKDLNGNAVVGAGWISADGTRVSVDAATGVATAQQNTTAPVAITASARGDAGAHIGVTVSQAAAVVAGKTSFGSLNETGQATATDSNGNAIPAGSLAWAACDGVATPPCSGTVASVSAAGVVRALKNGSAKIYAGVAGDVPASYLLTVAQVLSEVVVSPSVGCAVLSGTTTFTATPRDSGGFSIPGLPAASWQSGDPATATVLPNPDGTATAHGLVLGGPVTVTATISGVPGTAQLNVRPASVTLNWALNVHLTTPSATTAACTPRSP